jgi:hypothetical protein
VQGKTRVPALIHRYLEWAVMSGEVRSQDVFYALGALAGNAHARALSWEWLTARWAPFIDKFKDAGQMLG